MPAIGLKYHKRMYLYLPNMKYIWCILLLKLACQNPNEMSEYFEHLTPEEKSVIVDKGTEAPFTGEYNDFYEVDTVRENQLFVGRDSGYNLASYANNFGSSVSIIVDCHLTRADRVGISEVVYR